ncbi:MAG: alpha/beta fold hydrolase [Methyloceanibacter sp.]
MLVDEVENLQGVIAESAGHFVAEEDPEFFCGELERFLAA